MNTPLGQQLPPPEAAVLAGTTPTELARLLAQYQEAGGQLTYHAQVYEQNLTEYAEATGIYPRVPDDIVTAARWWTHREQVRAEAAAQRERNLAGITEREYARQSLLDAERPQPRVTPGPLPGVKLTAAPAKRLAR